MLRKLAVSVMVGLLCSAGAVADTYQENLAKGAATSKQNYLNDPFHKPSRAARMAVPETWPQFYNRGAIDRSPKDSKTKILTIGTGTPLPNTYRFGPAHALIVDGYPYFVDCGEGWFRAINRSILSQKGMKLENVLKKGNFKHLFLTHLHEDHTLGLPSFILSPYKYLGSTTDKVIFGPKGTQRMVSSILLAWVDDRAEMVQGSAKQSPEGSSASSADIRPETDFPGPFYEDDRVTVEAFLTKHGGLRHTLAYRFTSKADGRIVVFGGDGQYSKGLSDASKGADVLVTEAMTWDNLIDTPWGGTTLEDKQRIVGAYHLFPKDIKRIQDESGVKEIVLVHEQNYNKADEYDRLALLHEVQKAGVKNVYSSMDGDLY